jgi:Kef-type K+ transport system membrane component KefB
MKWLRDATSEAIFVGTAMVATSVGITARVVEDLRALNPRIISRSVGQENS